jgi:hypothetical protein
MTNKQEAAGNAVKERPIVFSGAMVRALLDGSKTQTRRVVKGQWAGWQTFNVEDDVDGREFFMVSGSPNDIGLRPILTAVRCPYGQPGDRLWVREAWARTRFMGSLDESFVYRECDNRTDYGGPWKPSIHMPRRASRILLEIVSVRVERLQDISDADAQAEGCSTKDMRHGDRLASVYARLWESINGAGSWDANPWVWVVEFKQVAP